MEDQSQVVQNLGGETMRQPHHASVFVGDEQGKAHVTTAAHLCKETVTVAEKIAKNTPEGV